MKLSGISVKVSRSKVAVLVLLVATLIYPVALYSDIQRYKAWQEAYLQNHSDMEHWIDFDPYFGTFSGGLLISIASILGICWVMVVRNHWYKIIARS